MIASKMKTLEIQYTHFIVCCISVSLCRRCGPRLSEAAAEKLKNRYVLMRGGARDAERESKKRSSIPITVR